MGLGTALFYKSKFPGDQLTGTWWGVQGLLGETTAPYRLGDVKAPAALTKTHYYHT